MLFRSPVVPLSPELASAWNARIALLEKSKGNLTFAKALAVLFEVSEPEDLEKLVKLESKILQSAYSHGAAIGIDNRGSPFVAFGGRFTTAAYIRNELLDFCGSQHAGMCKVIVLNREFDEKEFLAFAQHIKQFDLPTVRRALLTGLHASLQSISLQSGHSARLARVTNIFYSKH